ncbi:hypothetical protein AR457_03125 [Streptomyces agglomeratus]|uniref:Uncharacterized protein n=1 Tax=Streptomyces agglomeratus TaxID=285458 RepID=A0A1E5P277_9ACTN|nr:hypothetical protein AS594_03230 [Streptomyces agglomeratus]OEJ43228.1 hypothetical protein AR457_03125 [Streptomyces agglomeratus]OEJ54851.1 hypothetical protein BGK72_32645 [Streptomyces agglomeratus]OEJ62222.1 hypothetical protein BGM19_33560 [Streptomyces agglomeratus]
MGQIHRESHVHVQARTAQRCAEHAGDLLRSATGSDAPGTRVAQRNDRRAGRTSEAGQARAERLRCGRTRVPSAGQTALTVDQHVTALGQGRECVIERPGRMLAPPVHRNMTAPLEREPQERDTPKPSGGHDDGLDAHPVQSGQSDSRVGKRVVVGSDDAAGGKAAREV